MRKIRTYPFEKSPLYGKRNFSKVCELLKITAENIKWLKLGNETYRIFQLKQKGKMRDIQEPLLPLSKIHKRLLALLNRLPFPPYVFSGRRFISSISNASQHLGSEFAQTEDIKKFYPSCRKEYVFRFFKYRLMMVDDVAWELANLITFNNCIPTGSPLSQAMAYWAYADAFNEVDRLSKRNGILFTLYVDDMAFSSQKVIPDKFILGVRGIIRKYELDVNQKKSKKYTPSEFKLITGAAISPSKSLKVPNKHQQKLFQFKEANKNLELLLHPTKWKEVESIMGVFEYCRRVEPKFWNSYYQAMQQIERRILVMNPPKPNKTKGRSKTSAGQVTSKNGKPR